MKSVKDVLADRDRLHKLAVGVVSRAIRAMAKARTRGESVLERVMAMLDDEQAVFVEVADLARDAARFQLSALPFTTRALGVPHLSPADPRSFEEGVSAGFAFLFSALSREGIHVAIEDTSPAQPKAEPSKPAAQPKDPIGTLLKKSLRESLGQGFGGSGDLASELQGGIRDLLADVAGRMKLCAPTGTVLSHLRARRDYPGWRDAEGGAFEVKAGDEFDEVYDPSDEHPQRRALVNRRTKATAPFRQPHADWPGLFEVLAITWRCTCKPVGPAGQ